MSKKDWLVFLGAAIFIALFPLIIHPFKAISDYVDVMVFAGIFTMVCLGLSLLMGYAGQISLAQAAFFGIGAYSSGILTTHFDFNPWAAMPLGALLAGVVAWLVGKPTLRLKGHYLAMATLGFGVIVEIILQEEVQWTGGPSGMADIPGLKIAGFNIINETAWYYLVWTVIFLMILFCLNVIHSRMGRALKAIHEDERAAESMGVPTAKYKVQVFVLSAILASIGGSFYTHYVCCLNPSSFSLMWSIRFLLMVMLGGIHSLWGAPLGTVLLTFLGNEWLQVFAEFDILVYGGILLVVMLFLPGGLVSLFGRRSRLDGMAAAPVPPQSEVPVTRGAEPWMPDTVNEGSAPILELDDVTMHFGGLAALSGIGYQVQPGLIQAVIGPNGAGKTTLFNCISGVLKPTAGKIVLETRLINGLQPHLIANFGVSRTFQQVALFESMSVLENVMLGRHPRTRSGFFATGLRLQRMRREEKRITEEALNLLDFVGLAQVAHQPAGTLPFGKQKILEIARALATEPRLLLLDEPAGGLNMKETEGLGELIHKVRCQGITVMLVEHDMSLIMDISDRILVLNFGIQIASGTPQEIRDNPAVIEAYLGEV